MPYAPTVNDVSGQILAQGKVNAANYKAQGILGSAQVLAQGKVSAAESIAGGISSFGQSLGGGIAQAGQIFAQNRAKLSNAYGKIEQYGQMGYLTPQEADSLSAIKDPDKLAGALAVVDENFSFDMQRKRQAEAMQLRLAEDLLARSQSKVGQTVMIEDPATGQKHSFVWQNDSQIVPLDKKETKPGVSGVRKVQVSRDEFIYVDQAGQPINPKLLNQTVADPVQQAQISKLTQEKAGLEAEKAKGRGDKSASWWPWADTVNDKLKGVDAQINTLRGGAAPIAAQGTIAPAQQFKSAAEVKQAVQAGTLTREEAVKILRENFGMK